MKTDNQPLRNQQAVYCPTCERHTEQTRGKKRGTRHCWSCGNNFTLKESREAEKATQCEGCDTETNEVRITDDDVLLCVPCFDAVPAAVLRTKEGERESETV